MKNFCAYAFAVATAAASLQAMPAAAQLFEPGYRQPEALLPYAQQQPRYYYDGRYYYAYPQRHRAVQPRYRAPEAVRARPPVTARPRVTEPRKQAGANPAVRVIHVEGEVRILGSDRVDIKLYRRGGAPSASAE